MQLIAPLTLLLWTTQVHALAAPDVPDADVDVDVSSTPNASSPDTLFASVVSERDLSSSADDLVVPGLLAGRLGKRDCDYNGCTCNSRGRQITGCGNCRWTDNNQWLIEKKRVNNHIYECSPSGRCCSYGYAKDCGTASARCKIYP